MEMLKSIPNPKTDKGISAAVVTEIEISHFDGSQLEEEEEQ